MKEVNDVIVISDVHLAKKKEKTDKGQDLFQADEALKHFLTFVRKEIPNAQVVLNGDIFDYLVVSKTHNAKAVVEGFSELEDRTQAIINDHPDVFDALAMLAASSRHQLIITGGNHDPELVFPSVQQVIEKRLSNATNKHPIRWLVQGEALALKVGQAKTLIEHGDSLDAWNRIDRSELRSTISLASRGLLQHHKYTPPPGSKLVTDCLSLLKPDYPWVELLKPETGTVPYLLLYFLPKSDLPDFKRALFYWIQAAKESVIVKLSKDLDPTYLFRAGKEDRTSLDYFKEMWGNLERPSFTEFKKSALISKLRKAVKKDGFFAINEPEAGTYRVLSFLVRQGADLLIHGHTHSAKAYKVSAGTEKGDKEGLYLNSGTWARLMRLPEWQAEDKKWTQFVDGLKQGVVTSFEIPTFIRVRCDRNKTMTGLHEWTGDSPKQLAAYRFVPEHATWEQES